MPTLFLSDLDGTLLDPSGNLPADAAQRLRRLVDDGMLFSYATARSFRTADTLIAAAGIRLPVIVYGGAFLVEPLTGERLDSRLLEPDAVEVLLAACDRHGIPPLVYELEADGLDRIAWVAGAESRSVATYLAGRDGDPRLRPVATRAELPVEQVFYLSAIGARGPVDALTADVRERLGDRVSIVVQRDSYRPEEIWLEVTAPGADKATAALALRERVGADRLVCFGDNANDLPMFAVADHSVAVANAIDEVRAAASEVTDSNARGGVLRWLETQRQPPARGRRAGLPSGDERDFEGP